MRRRALIGGTLGVVATAALGAFAARSAAGGPVLRVGVMANLTHAPMLAGLGSGRIAAAVAPLAVETRVFRAGPRVTEALIGDAIDAGTSGPAPVVIHHARHRRSARGGLRVLSGCSSGGASLVVTRRSGIARADDLAGKRLAVTQIGTTQDVTLRSYLRTRGLSDTTAGGNVQLMAVAGATILAQMGSGDLDGAWLPEPWATRIVADLDAVRLVDERELWPNRTFSTSLLACRHDRAHDPGIQALKRALVDEVRRAQRDPHTAGAEAYAELKRHVGNPGSRAIFDAALAFIDFTEDPLVDSLRGFARQAAALDLCPPDATDGLFDDV